MMAAWLHVTLTRLCCIDFSTLWVIAFMLLDLRYSPARADLLYRLWLPGSLALTKYLSSPNRREAFHPPCSLIAFI